INSVLSQGFVSGNALTLRVDHVSGTTRTFSTYDRNPIYAARLEVTFESAGNDAFNTARTEFMNAVDSLSAEGFTPIQDTMFEAYNYYAGNPVVWGKYRGGHDENGNRINVANEGIDAEPFWYTRVSVEESITEDSFAGIVRPPGCTAENLSSTACDDPNGPGQPEGEYLAGAPVYKTPISHECQFESHIVFLTDGAANEPHSESLIKNAIGAGSCPYGGTSAQRCVVELAEHMNETDMNDELEGEQRVITHMVGFDFDEQWLEDIATAGGGTYATADSLETLVEQFKAIIAEVLKTDTSFVAPVAAINQFNRLTNLNDVYFAVFKPDSVPAWLGNLKRYRLGEFGGEQNVLLDANGVPAVDANTGFFRTSAQSYWSSSPDGTDVTAGGAAEKVPSYTTRKIYTDTGSSALLSAATNRIEPGNNDLTAALLGVDTTQRSDLIDWIRGKDTQDQDGDTVTSEDRFAINDPLHSRPVAVTYGQTVAGDPDVTIFFGTNSGNLHAIDAESGTELFSYIPQEMLGLQADVRANDGGIGHYYGLDGSAAIWTKNIGTSTIDATEGDHVYLYIGQRRGGRNYYALDVTDRNAPRLMWKIKGGEGDFGDLGQSWARPIPGKLNIDGIDKDVLYISGGYDLSNDNETLKNVTADSMGNAVYIVDATTGQKIWSVGAGAAHTLQATEMIHSIPATATVYDVDSDGLDDGMFIGDTGGQVWRFDFKQGQPVELMATGGIIARVGLEGSTLASENRRFFHAPDVALADIDGSRKLVVTIGSGSRPSPLSEVVNDRFYAFFQDSVFGPPSSYQSVLEGDDPATAVTETGDLYDATDNLIQTGDADQVAAELSDLRGSSGWFIDLERSGEKVLSTPLSFRNSVSFTTYQPVNEEGSCTPKAGTSRLYLVDLFDATATDAFGDDLSADPDAEPSRDYALDTPSIVEEPVIICTGDGCELFAGPEQPPVELLAGGQIIRTYWRQDQ
ncbi:MAG: PilC/PilY family type IV pilus protein, partial [Halieaceae bacterium]|nr:PilC/PilY family type IV pilus protein [Halieaceae bacterium]